MKNHRSRFLSGLLVVAMPPRGTHPRRFFMRADIPPAGSPPIFRRGAQRAPAGG